MCSTDRDIRAPYGSRIGQGITHPGIVEYDGGPDTVPVTYDGADISSAVVLGDTSPPAQGFRQTFDGDLGFMGNVIFADKTYIITSITAKISVVLNGDVSINTQLGIHGWDPFSGLRGSAAVTYSSDFDSNWVTMDLITPYTMTKGNQYRIVLASHPYGILNARVYLDYTDKDGGNNRFSPPIGYYGRTKSDSTARNGNYSIYATGTTDTGNIVSYDGYRSNFTITGGCPFCGIYTYDQEERDTPRK